MSEEVTRTRIIRDKKIEEKFPINYDAIQELVENTEKLFDILYSSYWDLFKAEGSKYECVEYVVFHEILFKFFIGIVTKLVYPDMIEEFKVKFLAYRLLFNLISNDGLQLHIGVLNRCKDTNKTWELFNRIEYLINNFETEILLSDTGDTENG